MQNLKNLLQEHDVNQADLARLLGRDRAVITNLLHGRRRLKAEEVTLIADYLNVSVDRVLGRKEAVQSGMAEPKMIPFQSSLSRKTRRHRMVVKKDSHYFLSERMTSDTSYALEVRDNSLQMLGILEGDIVVSDTKDSVEPGDIVVVQFYTESGAETLLRHYQPPLLIAHSADSHAKPVQADDENVRIVSPVNRLIRMY